MLQCPTFEAKIFVGMRAGYTGPTPASTVDATQILGNYCNEVGLCVTFEPTTFIYKGGWERGFVVGLINYPRFPSTPEKITEHALYLAHKLKECYEQHRVSVVTTDTTYTLGDSDTNSDGTAAAVVGLRSGDAGEPIVSTGEDDRRADR